MFDLVILVANIACVLVAFVSLACCFLLSVNLADPEWREEHTPAQIRSAWWLLTALGVVMIVAASGAWLIYTYLAAEAFYILKLFGLWYVIGYVSRFLLLVWRHEAFSPYFAPSWDEIWLALFYALGGPFVTVHLVKEVWSGRPPWTSFF